MLPFSPESLEVLQQRLPQAFEPLYHVETVTQGTVTRPGVQRQHVLDWADGLRMIVSRDCADDGQVLYPLSASVQPGLPLYATLLKLVGRRGVRVALRTLVQHTEVRWKELGGPPVKLETISREKGVPHWFGPVPEGVFTCPS